MRPAPCLFPAAPILTKRWPGYRLRPGVPVTGTQLCHIAGVLPGDAVADLLAQVASNSVERIQRAIDDLVAAGYTATQLLAQVMNGGVVGCARACL